MNERIVFMGTPEFACAILQTLIDEQYNVVGVVSQPDKKVGRNQEIQFTKVKELALKYNLKVIQPINIKEDYQEILALQPDLIITCAYGQIIPRTLLDYPKYHCINVHASLLPKLRGGAPIHKAIMYGEEKTGITLMYMAPKMDAGDILSSREIKIDDNDTVGTLYDKLMELGSLLIKEDLPKLLNNELVPVKQNEEEATYAYNVSKEEEYVDFNRSLQTIYNHIRSLIPIPVSYALLDGKKVKFWKVRKGKISNDNIESGTIIGFEDHALKIKAGEGYIYIDELQFEGKKRMSSKDFENGNGKAYIGKIFNK